MALEVSVAYLHFVSVGLLASLLVAEFFLYRPVLTTGEARRVALVDLGYGLAALAVVVTGSLRAIYFAKGWEFYSRSPFFWAKIGVFLALAFLSLPPTFHFMSWRHALKAGEAPTLDPAQYRRMRLFIVIELMLLPFIPLFAVLMARGIGIR